MERECLYLFKEIWKIEKEKREMKKKKKKKKKKERNSSRWWIVFKIDTSPRLIYFVPVVKNGCWQFQAEQGTTPELSCKLLRPPVATKDTMS
jgi:transcription antitermination factor NusG